MWGRTLALVLLATLASLGSVSGAPSNGSAAPATPTLTASVHAGGVTLRWSYRGNVTPSATTMEIDRAAGSAAFAELTSVSAPHRRQTWRDGNAPGGPVEYRIRLVSDAGTTAWSNVVTVTTTGGPGPGPGPGPGGNPPLAPGQQECPAGSVEQVLTLVNAARAKQNVPPLADDARLDLSARTHTISNASSQNLTHDGWVGYIRNAGYNGSLLGENIAYGYPSASAVVSAWLKSPGHLANIMDAGFRDSGVGCVVDSAGRFWWTQDFGG